MTDPKTLALMGIAVLGIAYTLHLQYHSGPSIRRGPVELIIAVMLSLPQWHLDTTESKAERTALLQPVATAIAGAAKTRTERAFLVAQSWHETKWARYVLEDRCSEGSPGERCDRGRAAGPWQVWAWCEGAHDETLSTTARFEAGARCSLDLYRGGLRICPGSFTGGFLAQRGGMLGGEPCAKAWAVKRAATMVRVLRRL